jgi:hypothetical protein
MPHSEAHEWWADVQHLREPIERRRAEATRAERARREARHDSAPAPEPLAAPGFAATRRTVQITGRTVPAPSVPRLVEIERRRPARRPPARIGPRPDRLAMWAVLLGFFLILVAATSSSQAATHAAGAQRHAALVSHGHLTPAAPAAPRLRAAH